MRPLYLLLTLVFLLSGFQGYAQKKFDEVQSSIYSGNNPQTMGYFEQFRSLIGTENISGNVTKNIKGSAYDNENFLKGTIVHEGKSYKNIWLRYNAYADEVEMKIHAPGDKDEEIHGFIKSPELSFVIGDEKVKYTEFLQKDKEEKSAGNVFVLYEGDHYSLYQRRVKIYKESKEATTSFHRPFPARFVDDTEYYLKVEGQTPVFVKPKLKSILSFVDNAKKSDVKNYIKKNDIDLKEGRGLAELMGYMDTL